MPKISQDNDEECHLSSEMQVDSKASALVGLNRDILGALSTLQSFAKICNAVLGWV